MKQVFAFVNKSAPSYYLSRVEIVGFCTSAAALLEKSRSMISTYETTYVIDSSTEIRTECHMSKFDEYCLKVSNYV